MERVVLLQNPDPLVDLLNSQIVVTNVNESADRKAFKALIDLVPAMLAFKNQSLEIVEANKAYCNLVGRPLSEIIGRNVFSLFPEQLAHEMHRQELRVIQSGEGNVSEHRIKGDSGTCCIETHIQALPGPEGGVKGLFWFGKDVTAARQREIERENLIDSLRDAFSHIDQQRRELHALNTSLADLATKDELTELPNRRLFSERFQEEWQRCRREKVPLALMMIDVDHFKLYNDHFGHPEGDECLRKVAQALQGEFGRGGDLLARYGGEEFVALLPNTGSGLRAKASTCLRCVRELNLKQAPAAAAAYVTVSIGAAVAHPWTLTRAADLLDLADQHLYLAKRAGRNTYSVIDQI